MIPLDMVSIKSNYFISIITLLGQKKNIIQKKTGSISKRTI